MASPIICKAWLNNVITGLPYTGIFKNYWKSKTKTIRLNDAINYLINTGLIQKGEGTTRHLVVARKETYFKTPPFMIRSDSNKLKALETININIDVYEYNYMKSFLPSNTELTEETIKMILSKDEFISICHLFNNTRIEQEMKRRTSVQLVEQEFVQGKQQYRIASASQQINNGTVFFKLALTWSQQMISIILFIFR